MSKIVSMSSGAIDPIAQSKRVFWRPVTEATVIKAGQPVCYHSDSIYDHKDRSKDPTHLGLTEDTYAEGAQDKTARLFCVEEPLTANLNAFAGIVKSLGPKAGADGDMIEIFVPNGAVLPCWIDQSVKLDETILGIRDGEADVSYPGNGVTNPGKPIGVAKETIDRSADADNGLVWVKVDPNMFSSQYGISDAAYLKVEGSSGLNRQYVEITSTTPVIGFLQDNRLLYNAALASGQLIVENNYLHFTGSSTAAAATYIRGTVNMVHLDTCTLNGAGLIIAGAHDQLGGTPTFNTRINFMCGLWVDVGVGVAPTTGDYYGMRISNNGTGIVNALISFAIGPCDFIFKFESYPTDPDPAILKMLGNHDFDTDDYALKVQMGTDTFYIPLMDALA